MSLSSQSYVFFPQGEGILPTTAKRYWKGPASEGGITLVCAHCTTSHKEAYEPFIEDLYEALPTGFIREVWAVEHPNHGEAAVINEATLLAAPYSQQCEVYFLAAVNLILERFIVKWRYGAESLHAFLNGHGTGVDVDFSQRRVVGLAQSSGACIMSLAMAMQPNITPEHLIIIEPITGPPEYTATLIPLVEAMNRTIKNRRDIWPSREEAGQDLRRKGVWKYYDQRVFDIYLKHGLRDLPTATYGADVGPGVTPACTLAQEVAIQLDFQGANDVFLALPQLAKRTSLHLMWSKVHHPMLLPLEMKGKANENARPASVTWVDGPHLLLQLNPRGLAKAVSSRLTRDLYAETEREATRL